MAKIKMVYFSPEAVCQNGRERIQTLTGAQAEFEVGAHQLRVRWPERKLDFAVALSTATIEYEWAEREAKTEVVQLDTKGKFRP